jgi:TrmH family RNA methyltransferase
MPDILSPHNERVRYAVRLRERRYRQQEGQMLVEGVYELTLALHSGLQPRTVFLCEELARERPAALLALQPLTVSRAAFAKMSYRENPDGWLAIFPCPRRTLESLALSATPLLILTEAVEKPGNLGAILRTADAAGVDGVLVCDPRADLYNPNVVRASRGTLFTVPAIETSNAAALTYLRAHGISLLATTPQAEALYTEVNLSQPLCIAVGAEDEGLSPFWLRQADWQVRIPMQGRVNSLNVATATAIVLYEALRQRAQVSRAR